MKTLKSVQLIFLSLILGLVIPGYALAQKTFVFDPQQHEWFAYDNGELIKSGSRLRRRELLSGHSSGVSYPGRLFFRPR